LPDAKITLSKNEIKNMLHKLSEQNIIYAPASNGKKLDYLQTSSIDDIIISDELPYKSPKEVFFPRCEKIITFINGEAAAPKREEKAVLFGARPCDLSALEIMKKVFTEGKFADPYFEERYDNALIIGIACVSKKPGCFCDKRETDMGYSDKCDLFLGAAGDNYEVLYVSEKGAAELGRVIEGLDKFENTAHDFKPEETLMIEAAEEELFTKIDWEKIAGICQGCGICSFICPTCHCFMLKDTDSGDSACRYRNWDSCMFPKFTEQASGHNPRAQRHARYRQRIAHKFLYVRKNFGTVACTGCGRCIRSCPAGMDINAVVDDIARELK